MKFIFGKTLLRIFRGPNVNYHQLAKSSNLISNSFIIISLQLLSIITLSLPLFGFTFCVIWSVVFNFTEATSTHCGVSNYLPSISASIGSFSPQKYIWRSTISLHTSPRYLISFIFYKSIHHSNNLLIFNWIEISALLALSIVSSTELFRNYK